MPVFYTVVVSVDGLPFLEEVDTTFGMYSEAEAKAKAKKKAEAKAKAKATIEKQQFRAKLEFERWLALGKVQALEYASWLSECRPKATKKKASGKLMAKMSDDILAKVLGYLSHKEYHGTQRVSHRFTKPAVLNLALKYLTTVGNPVYVLDRPQQFGIISGVPSISGDSSEIKIVRTGKCVGIDEHGKKVRSSSISFKAVLVVLWDKTFAIIPSAEVPRIVYGNNSPAKKSHVTQCPYCRHCCNHIESEIGSPFLGEQEAVKLRTFAMDANLLPLDSSVMSSVICPLHRTFAPNDSVAYNITASYIDGRRLPITELRMKVSLIPCM